jgi:hypothetical protein
MNDQSGAIIDASHTINRLAASHARYLTEPTAADADGDDVFADPALSGWQ